MRKLLWMGALVGTLAAGAANAQGTAEESKEAANAAAKDAEKAAEKAGDEAKAAGQSAEESMDQQAQKAEQQADQSQGTASGTASEQSDPAAQSASAGSQQRTTMQEKQKNLWEGKEKFDIKGKVSKASQNSITVTRDDLPSATLQVSKQTKIEVDGQEASAKQLKPGQEVQASFNLQGNKPIALEIKAEKSEQQQQ